MGLMDQFKTIGLLVLGAVILIAHVVVFILNQFIFTVMLSLYIIGYTVLILVITYKKRNCYDSGISSTSNSNRFSELNLIYNMSIYTIFLQVFLIILSLGYMFAQKYIKKY